MTQIKVIKQIELNDELAFQCEKQIKEIYSEKLYSLIEVNLIKNAKFSKHKAKETITILCLSGNAELSVGKELKEKQVITAGTLIALEAELEHEVFALTNLRLLITKYKS